MKETDFVINTGEKQSYTHQSFLFEAAVAIRRYNIISGFLHKIPHFNSAKINNCL